MSEWKGAYVCHVCRDCECAFIAEDYTNAKDIPPKWRRCSECAEKAGIGYASQKPSDYWTEEQKERYKKCSERLKEHRNKKINSESTLDTQIQELGSK